MAEWHGIIVGCSSNSIFTGCRGDLISFVHIVEQQQKNKIANFLFNRFIDYEQLQDICVLLLSLCNVFSLPGKKMYQ